MAYINSVLSIYIYQYTEVTQFDTSTFIYTNSLTNTLKIKDEQFRVPPDPFMDPSIGPGVLTAVLRILPIAFET